MFFVDLKSKVTATPHGDKLVAINPIGKKNEKKMPYSELSQKRSEKSLKQGQI
jgi:hypothetical protein